MTMMMMDDLVFWMTERSIRGGERKDEILF